MGTSETVISENTELYWHKQAELLPWFTPWEKVLDWQAPNARWFVGGKINASYACLDVHIQAQLQDKLALIWCDETGAERLLTYQELYEITVKFADALQKSGIKAGDVVAIFMPLIPEAVAAMLAIARLGAIHCVIFSGFGAEALRTRIKDVGAKIIITATAGRRRGKLVTLKETLDQAIEENNNIQKVIVVKHTDHSCHMKSVRDVYMDDFIANSSSCPPEPVASDHPLFILHTSGSTGKPKGIVHATGGYLTYVYSTFKTAFGITPHDIYWCTGDIGWITGHSYLVYGPLMHGATIVLYEGAPDYPTETIWWHIIERYKVTVFYTAPTAIRLFIKQGDEKIAQHNLTSLRILGSVGEPLNPQVWEWYARVIGKNRCSIIDTWWQTETGGFMISPQINSHQKNAKPGSVMCPLPGIDADVVSAEGDPVDPSTKGFLVIKKPWPGMLAGVWGNNQLHNELYWSRFNNMFDTGDCAIKDEDGCYWILGRCDEVIKIAGHRIGTAEVETAVLTHPAVVESAAIGIDDPIRGQAIALFVVLSQETNNSHSLREEITHCVHKNIGRFVVITDVFFVKKLPKTRSGKILRRVLKALTQNAPLGDLTTMEDDAVLGDIIALYEQFRS